MVALLGGAQVLRSPGLPEGVDDGGEGGGAFGGQVAPGCPPGRGWCRGIPPCQEPDTAPGQVVLRVGLLGPPRLVRRVTGASGRRGCSTAPAAAMRILSASDWSSSSSIRPVHRDLPRPRDRDGAAGGRLVQQRVPAQQAHLPDGGLGVELGARRGSWRRASLVVACPSASWSSAASNRRISPLAAAPSREVMSPELLQASARAGPWESSRGRGVPGTSRGAQGDFAARPPALANPGRGQPGRIPSRLPCTSTATPFRWFTRRLRAVGRGPPGASATSCSLTRAACLPYRLPVRSMIIKYVILHDFLFDNCRLRHRHDNGLDRSRAGPFDKTALIYLGICPATTAPPSAAPRRPILERVWELDPGQQP